MTELKCPFCGEKLQQTYSFNPTQFWCSNYYNHKHPINLQGTKELWQALIDTKKTLEQSETCCTEWEKQALDYKSENIALSGDLERTRKALDKAKLILKNLLPDLDGYKRLDVEKAINEITALEQKDK